MFKYISLLLIIGVGFTACSSTEELTTFTPDPGFDANNFINPNKYVNDDGTPSSNFTPVSIKGGSIQMYQHISYPKAARKDNAQGKVILELYVDSLGTLTNIIIRDSPHNSLTNVAVNAAANVNYNPAMLNGEPVNSFTQFPLSFALPKEKNNPIIHPL